LLAGFGQTLQQLAAHACNFDCAWHPPSWRLHLAIPMRNPAIKGQNDAPCRDLSFDAYVGHKLPKTFRGF